MHAKDYSNFKSPYTRCFKRDHEKVNFCTQPPFMEKIMKNKKGVELVTSLSLSCRICLDKFNLCSDPLNLKTVERKGRTSKIFNILMKRGF